jgi:hypothetical protein
MNDRRRQLSNLDAKDSIFQYIEKETQTFPQEKNYAKYKENAQKFQRSRSKKPVDGVSGIWKLDKLPYADHIVWVKDAMHCFTNIIKDSMNVLTPSQGKFINRSEKDNVRHQCKVAGIHEHLHMIPGVLGCRKPFTNGGGQYSHDKLTFAIVYARRVLSGFGDPMITGEYI